MSKIKSRLGRGLSSLISVSELPVEAAVDAPASDATQALKPSAIGGTLTSPSELPVDQIKPNPHQPRRQFNDGTLAELAASLKSTGLIQPIVVRRVEDGF